MPVRYAKGKLKCVMKKLVEQIKIQATEKNACCLVALIESEGSTPRGSGAYMLVNKQGLVCGTIGGGSMEYAAICEAQKNLACGTRKSFLKAYDLSPAAGMACGGSCSLQFCYLDGACAIALAEKILAKLAENKPWWLMLPLGEGEIVIKNSLPIKGRRGLATLNGKKYYVEQQCYDGMVYVFGAGHVARELVPLLCHLGFCCAVFDDRAEFADAAVFPMAEFVKQVDFCRLQEACELQENDYAVVMTRGHEHDANCERFLLHTSVGYIGIMGSKNKAKMARQALLAEGYTDEQLMRITTPIGLQIGSETPAEIAVSIAAQLIQVRAAKA